MRSMSTGRRLTSLAAAVALTSTMVAGTAGAAPTAEPPSTPVDTTPADGVLMSYVVNLKPSQINYGQMKKAEKLIKEAGGTVVQSWPEIGVIVAHSTRSAFVPDLPSGPASPIESAGQTRTAEVHEGTPQGDTVQPPKRDKVTEHHRSDGDTTGHETVTQVVADPRESEQWGNFAIKADKAHAINPGSPDVVVGVLDSGVDGDHPDLAPNFRPEKSVGCQNAGVPDPKAYRPATSSHGTHVAGTIGAARNGEGVVGIAPKTSIAGVRVSSDAGYYYPEYVVCGMMWSAKQGFDITNNSYYIDPWNFWCGDQANQAPGREAVRRAMAYANGQGVAHVAASGNDTYDLANKTTDSVSPNDTTPVDRTINSDCLDIPTEMPGAVSVASVAKTDDGVVKSGFSNYGENKITVAAPGSRILSTVIGGKYGISSGTSMASPHVAGVMALIKAANPGLTAEQLVATVQEQADPQPCPDDTCVGRTEFNSYYGHGLVNALTAVTE